MKNDRRFYSWPRLRKTKSGYLIKARVMTSIRFELLNTFIRVPLQKLWRFIVGLLVLDASLNYLGLWCPSDFLPITATGLICAIAAMSALHYVELFSRLWVSIFFFGIRIRFEVTEDEVLFRRFGARMKFPRGQRVVFAAAPIPQAQAAGYVDSRFIEAVVDNSATYRLFECYDVRKANKLVINFNYANNLGDHSAQEEFDPRER